VAAGGAGGLSRTSPNARSGTRTSLGGPRPAAHWMSRARAHRMLTGPAARATDRRSGVQRVPQNARRCGRKWCHRSAVTRADRVAARDGLTRRPRIAGSERPRCPPPQRQFRPRKSSGSTSAWSTDTTRQGGPSNSHTSNSGRQERIIPRLSRVRIHSRPFAAVRTPHLTSQNGSEPFALVRQNRLPKLRTRVRFSSPAHNKNATKAHFVVRFPSWARPGCHAIPGCNRMHLAEGPSSLRRRASAVDPGRDARGQAAAEFGPTSSGRFGPDRPDRHDRRTGWISIRKRALRQRPGSRPR
jgi:hypothetical protein